MSLGAFQACLLGEKMTRDGGKGDAPRPLGVPMDKFDEAWDRIFKEKDGSLTLNVEPGEAEITIERQDNEQD